MSQAPEASERPPVGRFAPSPTGPLHPGSLVAALGSYALARRFGGRWLLRIEDLDAPRVVHGAADDILRTLEALGFTWDGPVVRQSQRGEAYEAALAELSALGAVYPCACSRAEIARASTAPHGEDGPAYPGTCRDGLPAGTPVRALRVRVPPEEIAFQDGVAGLYGSRLADCGDFVVRRADGPFAYQLAVVVDDAHSGVTQVVRGSDLLSSTPRQVHLQCLLGYDRPSYWHLPLVTGPGGTKLSKRDNALSLARGLRSRAEGGDLLLRALRFLGQRPPPSLRGAPPIEVLSWAATSFDPSAVPPAPGPFPATSE
ncbi:MAG: tRNA glutamyl-Q(34) synthetase GluQRS [Deltaproteobacteria bacterium]|nr:tRNA glutamyl-Q(34) synthetase GluQRS [Deltaproteobacteria bacterium]